MIAYICSIQKSISDRSYAIPLLSQCLNLSWEITFGFISPPDHWLVELCFRSVAIVNGIVTYTAIRYGSREWDHAPLVKCNLPILFLLGLGVAISGYMAIEKQLGSDIGGFVIAIALQVILSVGSLIQLLVRGTTRSASFTLWFVLPPRICFLSGFLLKQVADTSRFLRFLGSLILVPEANRRAQYWPEVFGFIFTPSALSCCKMFFLTNLSYGLCFWYVRNLEQSQEMGLGQKKR